MVAMSVGSIGPIPAAERWRYRAAAGEAPPPPKTPGRRPRVPEPLTRETQALTVLTIGLSVASICLIVAAAYITTILP